MKATFTPTARRDVFGILAWISEDRPKAARAFYAAIDELAKLLAQQPMIGTERPDLASPPIRFWPLKRYDYVVVYRADRRPPVILRVLHASRDLGEILQNLPLD